MKILYVSHVAATGGVAQSQIELLVRARHAVSVVLLEDGPLRVRLATLGVPVAVLRPGRVLKAVGTGGLASLCSAAPHLTRAAGRHDLLYAGSAKAFMVAGLAAAAARRPILWHLHELPGPQALNTRLATALATHIICGNQAVATALHARGCRVPCTVVPIGLEPLPFLATDEGMARATRDVLGIDTGTPLLGVFGRLAPWKGQHVVIEALERLPGVHVLFVGAALFGEAGYVGKLQRLATARGVAERVHFLGFREDVPALMAAVDVVVHAAIAPRPFEPVIVEGMLSGRPVIATRAGGALEVVEAGRTGLLVAPGDAVALARAVDGLLAHPDRARRLGAAGRRHALENFSVYASRVRLEQALERASGLLRSERGRGAA
jgi:glycosyltransferase involved in cell wall biosynthesis